MIVASPHSTGFRIVEILHFLAVIVAFAPAVAHPVMAAQARKGMDPQARNSLLGFMAANTQRLYGNALVLAGLLGFALVGMSDDVYEMSEGWIVTSIIIWVAMTGLVHALLAPAERRVASGDSASEKLMRSASGLLTVLGIVMVYLMVFKPGR